MVIAIRRFENISTVIIQASKRPVNEARLLNNKKKKIQKCTHIKCPDRNTSQDNGHRMNEPNGQRSPLSSL